MAARADVFELGEEPHSNDPRPAPKSIVAARKQRVSTLLVATSDINCRAKCSRRAAGGYRWGSGGGTGG